MKITDLKNGDKVKIIRWLNQPDYIGNTIEMISNELIMTDKNGIQTRSIDMRYPHYAIIEKINEKSGKEMSSLFKWQQDIIDNIATTNNEELLDETLSLSRGDSYDGLFTKQGEWEYKAYYKELVKRLTDIGFLPQETKIKEEKQ